MQNQAQKLTASNQTKQTKTKTPSKSQNGLPPKPNNGYRLKMNNQTKPPTIKKSIKCVKYLFWDLDMLLSLLIPMRVDVSSHASFGLEGKYACLKKFYSPHMENFLWSRFQRKKSLMFCMGIPCRLFWDTYTYGAWDTYRARRGSSASREPLTFFVSCFSSIKRESQKRWHISKRGPSGAETCWPRSRVCAPRYLALDCRGLNHHSTPLAWVIAEIAEVRWRVPDEELVVFVAV